MLDKARYDGKTDMLSKMYQVLDLFAWENVAPKYKGKMKSPGFRLGHYNKNKENFEANRKHIQKHGINRPKKMAEA